MSSCLGFGNAGGIGRRARGEDGAGCAVEPSWLAFCVEPNVNLGVGANCCVEGVCVAW